MAECILCGEEIGKSFDYQRLGGICAFCFREQHEQDEIRRFEQIEAEKHYDQWEGDGEDVAR